MSAKLYIICLLFIIPCLFVAALYSQPLHAVSAANGITVKPAVKDIIIPPDQYTASFPMYVTNNTQSETTLFLSMVDFGQLDESGGVAFIGEESTLERKYGLAAWSALDKPTLTLKPGQSDEINVTIVNRPSLALGGHYGAVLFKLNTSSGNDLRKVKLNQVFSALILAKKAGGDTYDLQLDKAERTNNTYSLPETIKLRFYNGGNVHIAPGGTVSLVDPLGREVARGTINPEVGRVLPEEFRVFLVSLKPMEVAWAPGQYQLIIKYNFDERSHFVTYKSPFIFINGLGMAFLVGLCLLAILMIWHRKEIKAAISKKHKL